MPLLTLPTDITAVACGSLTLDTQAFFVIGDLACTAHSAFVLYSQDSYAARLAFLHQRFAFVQIHVARFTFAHFIIYQGCNGNTPV